MKNLAQIHRLLAAPWAIDRRWIPAALAAIQQAAEGDAPTAPADPAAPEDLIAGQVAVLPIQGVLLQHPASGWAGSPVTYTEWAGAAFDALMADPEVAAIVLDMDTPGGIIYGTAELADKIFAARGQKPVLAVANALAASAGYWIGTAADQLFVTTSGDVGSVGVWTMHADWSGALEQMGIDVTLISAGEYKVEGNWYEPLSDEARAELQRGVDESYQAFLEAVARNMAVSVDTVRSDFGQGRVLSAPRALAAGMVHGVATLDEVIVEAARLAGVPPVPAVEGRRAPQAGLEVRNLSGAIALSDGDFPLVGQGTPYGRESADMGGWREIFEAGAFRSSIENGDQRVIWQHDPRCVLGRVGAGTARVWEEDGGVQYAASPPSAQWARDAMESVRRGDVTRSSIGFRALPGGARWERRDGYDLRIVSRAELVELGPQTYPAYEDTSVAVRERAAWLEQRALQASAEESRELMRELEEMEATL